MKPPMPQVRPISVICSSVKPKTVFSIGYSLRNGTPSVTTSSR
jgi:hypothetical protein